MRLDRGKYNNCLNCRFSDSDQDGFGICVRYPPTMHIIYDQPRKFWPYVYDDEWCGEFQEWPDEPEDEGICPPYSDKDLVAYMKKINWFSTDAETARNDIKNWSDGLKKHYSDKDLVFERW